MNDLAKAKFADDVRRINNLTKDLTTALNNLAVETTDRQTKQRCYRICAGLRISGYHYLNHVEGALSALGLSSESPESEAHRPRR